MKPFQCYGTNAATTHTYPVVNGSVVYQLMVAVTLSGATTTISAPILIPGPVVLTNALISGNLVNLKWPKTSSGALLENRLLAIPSAGWSWVANPPSLSGNLMSLTLPASGSRVFRPRQAW